MEPDVGVLTPGSREPARARPRRSPGGAAAATGVVLIAIHFVPFLFGLAPWAELLQPGRGSRYASFIMGALVRGTEPDELWRVGSAIFLHGGLLHLLFNVVALRALGLGLEAFIGPSRFLAVFFLSGWGGNLASPALGSPGLSLGASGAIYGVGAAWATVWALRARGSRGLRAPLGLGVLLLISLGVGLLLDARTEIRLDHAAHLGGLLVGGALGAAFGGGALRGEWRTFALLASCTALLPPGLALRVAARPSFAELVPRPLHEIGLTVDVPSAWQEEKLEDGDTVWTERGVLRLHLQVVPEPASRQITPEALVETKLGFLEGEVETPLELLFRESRLGALGGVLVAHRAGEEVWWLRCFDWQRSIVLFHLRGGSGDDEIEGARRLLRSVRE